MTALTRMTRTLALLLALLLPPIALAQHNQLSPDEQASGWALLFNGTSTEGWTTPADPAAWAAKDGELIVAKPGKGWWLRTGKMYRDFELMLDFNVPPNGNSGVGLRGSSVGDPAFTGFEVQIFDSHGKEPANNQCGGVYNAIAPTTIAVNPAGEWNTYRIKLIGDTLDVWLNGEHIHQAQKLDGRGYTHDPKNANPLSDRLTTGYISLQDHGDAVRFRNIKIRDLSPDKDPGGWTPLINGKDTTGWHQRGGGAWKVEGGTLVGRDGPGHLFSDSTYTDHEIRAFVRVNTRGNSGLYFRTYPHKDNPDTWPNGYEAQVDNHDPKNFTGTIYDRAWPADHKAPITRDNAWFDYRIRAVGNHIQTWIDGVPMVDAEMSNFAQGHIALQTHHQGNQIEYRDLQVRDLSRPSKESSMLPAAATRPVRLFYCTHSAGFRHDVLPETREIMKALGQKHDWLEVEVSDDITDLDADKLKTLDAVMLYTTGRLPLDVEMLTEWVARGGALIGVHSATDTLADDRIYVEKIGGTFDGHPWNEPVTIIIDKPDHPAMRPFITSFDVTDRPSFEIADEIYQFRTLNPANVVLMRLAPDTPKAEPGREYPLAWVRDSGKGRVFYTALGHRPEVWRDARFIDHLLGGICWATRR